MEWWKRAVLLIALLILVVGSFFGYRIIARYRDLHETLLWMNQTYNPHDGGDNLGQGHGWEIHYLQKGDSDEETERFKMTFAYDGGCDITIRTETLPVGVFSDTPSVTTDKFNLRDIDPTSIKVKSYDSHKDVFSCDDPEQVKLYQLNCDRAEINFRTRNGVSAISENMVETFVKLTGRDHEFRDSSKTNKGFWIAEDGPYARRLAKAFAHAVELCGGQPSKF